MTATFIKTIIRRPRQTQGGARQGIRHLAAFAALAALGGSINSSRAPVHHAAERRCLTQFFYGFRRNVRHFLGSISALFCPSGALCFPVRQGALREEEQQQQQEQQEGSMSHMSHCTTSGIWYKNWSKIEYNCFSRVSDDTLGTFWARFWRRSVLQGHCVSLSVRFQPREEEQQQQQEQQEGSMSHCTTSGIKTGRKLLFF